MDHRSAAMQRLCSYEIMRTAVENLRTQLRLVKLTRESIPGFRPDRVPVNRSPGGFEDRLVEDLLRQQELEKALEQTLLWMMVTDRALEVLEPDELMILRQLYIKKAPGALRRVCQLLGTEKSTVYRKRDKALGKFTMALYGAESTQESGA